MQKYFAGLFFLLLAYAAHSQRLAEGRWRAELLRSDGMPIVFNFDLSYQKGKPVIYLLNASEKMEVRAIQHKSDSVHIDLPFFESMFALKLQPNGTLTGNWIKGTSKAAAVMPMVAYPNNNVRFAKGAAPQTNLTGKWEMSIARPDGSLRPAIAQLNQKGDQLTGTILTPSGDYRYLDGTVRGDSLFLSTFDGSHAYVFSAGIKDDNTITGGKFFSGATHLETFTAVRNENASLPMKEIEVTIQPNAAPLDFRFPDLNGKLVGIQDGRFKNKVVVIQIMGSWCPNCMDETAFLSRYYKENKRKGLEMVALAYEYSTDLTRSVASLKKFQQRFDVQYPMLITGVTSSDPLRTEKTLPQITAIKVFPSTIFVGKDGSIKKVHSGFFGPATGEAYTTYVREFEDTVNALLAE